MISIGDILAVSLLGLIATCSNVFGAALGLYYPLSKRVLSCLLAFAAGALINALAIDLAYQGALDLHGRGVGLHTTLYIIGGGFALGAAFYYFAALYLERKGAAIRYPTRFREYARERKRQNAEEIIQLLSGCELLRHLPPEDIEEILPCIRNKILAPGEILFRTGDPGDALYIVAKGTVEVTEGVGANAEHVLAELGSGQAFGEMALLSGGLRTATIRTVNGAELLAIEKQDFDDLVAHDRQLTAAVEHLSHERAIQNLAAGGASPDTWAQVASSSLDHLSRKESDQIFAEVADGAGLAIVFGNILDTIPGCLVIGSKFVSFESMSLTLIIGMFLGGIPEAAASAAMLRKANYRASAIFLLWSAVMLVGVVAAIAGKMFLGSASLTGIFSQAVAGGSVLALIAHAMIPEAIEEAGSLIVLPTVGGFLFAFYLSLSGMFPA